MTQKEFLETLDQPRIIAAIQNAERETSGEIRIDDRLVNLSPGMAVTVEIKTGSRRILNYLLSPLLRYGQETLRER